MTAIFAIAQEPIGGGASASEQFVEAEGGATGEDEIFVAMQQADGGQIAYRSLDCVAPGEIIGLPRDFAKQLVEGDVDGVEGQQLVEDRRLRGRIFLGGGSGVLRVVHGNY
jgi:hypothetical protein